MKKRKEMNEKKMQGSVALPAENRDRLWTKDYVFVCMANFMMCFAFYMLVPTLPFYLVEVFGASKTVVGIVLSCYTVAVLLVRPFSGFLADAFSRKPVYIIAYFFFVSIFVGYLLAGTLLLFTILRVFHGMAFGTVTTTGNTVVIDVMPSSRRGEGLGYYGVMNNLAMSMGPMIGLFISTGGDFDTIFMTSIISGSIGLIFALSVHVPRKIPQTNNKIWSVDRFFLTQGIPACLSLLLLAIPYGMTTTFIAMYASELGLTANTGLFFTVMAVGLIVSRIGSGKRVDRGLITQVIRQGMYILLIGLVCEAVLGAAASWSIALAYGVYFAAAFFIGFGYGTLFPAYNTLFINLAPNNRRATANATYLTGWDVGIGIGMFFGGNIAQHYGFVTVYRVDVLLALLSLIWFTYYVTAHFNRHKVR